MRPLTREQESIEERLRTISLCLCGLAVVTATLYYCRSVRACHSASRAGRL